MSGLRLSATALFGAASVLVAMVCVPAAASASSPNITITSAGPDASGDPYDLTVVANDGNGAAIQSMTAHVYSASNQDVADATMTPLDTSDPTNQTWAAATPIAESQMPAGTYTVTVDANDGTESDQGLSAPGSFTFSYNSSSLAVAPAPPSVALGSQSVTFTGTLTGSATGGTPVGIANAPVSLSISGGAPTQVAITDSNGNFTYSLSGITQSADYNFAVTGTGSYPAANDDVTVNATPATTSMTVAATPATVTEGIQTVTFAGNVTATVTPPAPASPTTVNIGSGVPVYMNGTQVTTTDDAQGDFTYTTPGTAPGDYTFSIQPTSLYTGTSYQVTVGSQMAPTTMTVQASQPNVTFGSTSVTFTGAVTANPQGGSTQGIGSGVPVYLSIGGGAANQVTTTTDASGDFSYTVDNITGGTDYDFSVNSTALYDAASDDISIPVVRGTTALTASASPPDINLASSTVAFSGTVSVTPSGSTTSVGAGSGVPVYLSIGGGAATQVTTTTDANGDFSYTATGITSAADYAFSVDQAALYTAGSISVPIGQNQVQSALTVTPTPRSVTEGSGSVSFAASLTGVSPGGSASSAVAIQNVPIYVTKQGGSTVLAGNTDANGDFTYRASGIAAATSYTFYVAQTGSYTSATTAVPIGVMQAPTRITGIAISPGHLKYGQDATLTGTVQYQNGSVWTALPGSVVQLQESKTSLGSVTASSAGTFSAKLPTTHGPGWSATVGSATLTQQATATGNLIFAVPMKVRSFTASLGVSNTVTVAGCLQVTAPVGYGPQTTVLIQYATTNHGVWKSFASLTLHNAAKQNKTCPGADESYFSGAIKAKLPNAYYRANFAATDSFQGAVSPVVHAWKTQTRIVSFSAAPRSITTTGIVTIKARLEFRAGTWKPWGGQSVTVIYNYKGTSTWEELDSGKTGPTGWVTIKAKGAKGSFVAVTYIAYPGNKTHLASRSNGIDISINGGTSSRKAVGPNLADLSALPQLAVPMLPAFEAAGPPIAWLAAP